MNDAPTHQEVTPEAIGEMAGSIALQLTEEVIAKVEKVATDAIERALDMYRRASEEGFRQKERADTLAAELAAEKAKFAKLVEAAEPLAAMAKRYDPEDDDGDLECWSGLAVPKIKHIRAIRTSLAAIAKSEATA